MSKNTKTPSVASRKQQLALVPVNHHDYDLTTSDGYTKRVSITALQADLAIQEKELEIKSREVVRLSDLCSRLRSQCELYQQQNEENIATADEEISKLRSLVDKLTRDLAIAESERATIAGKFERKGREFDKLTALHKETLSDLSMKSLDVEQLRGSLSSSRSELESISTQLEAEKSRNYKLSNSLTATSGQNEEMLLKYNSVSSECYYYSYLHKAFEIAIDMYNASLLKRTFHLFKLRVNRNGKIRTKFSSYKVSVNSKLKQVCLNKWFRFALLSTRSGKRSSERRCLRLKEGFECLSRNARASKVARQMLEKSYVFCQHGAYLKFFSLWNLNARESLANRSLCARDYVAFQVQRRLIFEKWHLVAHRNVNVRNVFSFRILQATFSLWHSAFREKILIGAFNRKADKFCKLSRGLRCIKLLQRNQIVQCQNRQMYLVAFNFYTRSTFTRFYSMVFNFIKVYARAVLCLQRIVDLSEKRLAYNAILYKSNSVRKVEQITHKITLHDKMRNALSCFSEWKRLYRRSRRIKHLSRKREVLLLDKFIQIWQFGAKEIKKLHRLQAKRDDNKEEIDSLVAKFYMSRWYYGFKKRIRDVRVANAHLLRGGQETYAIFITVRSLFLRWKLFVSIGKTFKIRILRKEREEQNRIITNLCQHVEELQSSNKDSAVAEFVNDDKIRSSVSTIYKVRKHTSPNQKSLNTDDDLISRPPSSPVNAAYKFRVSQLEFEMLTRAKSHSVQLAQRDDLINRLRLKVIENEQEKSVFEDQLRSCHIDLDKSRAQISAYIARVSQLEFEVNQNKQSAVAIQNAVIRKRSSSQTRERSLGKKSNKSNNRESVESEDTSRLLQQTSDLLQQSQESILPQSVDNFHNFMNGDDDSRLLQSQDTLISLPYSNYSPDKTKQSGSTSDLLTESQEMLESRREELEDSNVKIIQPLNKSSLASSTATSLFRFEKPEHHPPSGKGMRKSPYLTSSLAKTNSVVKTNAKSNVSLAKSITSLAKQRKSRPMSKSSTNTQATAGAWKYTSFDNGNGNIKLNLSLNEIKRLAKSGLIDL